MIRKESISSIAIPSSQQRVLNFQAKNVLLYVQCAIEISVSQSETDLEKLRYAAGCVLEKYDVLRTSYQWDDALQSMAQVFDDSKGIDFEVIAPQGDQTYENYLDDQRKKVLNSNNPLATLLNVSFLKTSDSTGLVLLLIPAVAADSTSLKNIARDFCDFYLDKESSNKDAIISYQKFCNWHHDLAQNPDEEAITFWKKYAYKEYLNIKLPFELSPQSNDATLERANLKEGLPNKGLCRYPEIQTLKIDGPVFGKLKDLSLKYKLQQEVIILACLNMLVSKYTLTDGVTIGVVANERMFEELGPTVGLIAKVLPLSTVMAPSLLPEELFHQVSNTIKEIIEFQEGFDIDRELGKGAFFPIGFESILLTENLGLDEVTFELKNFISSTDRFKLKLTAVEKNNSLTLDFYFDPNYFNQEAVETITSHYQTLLNNILEDPTKEIADYKVISAPERNKILNEFNPLPKHGNSSKLIIALFEKQAESSPGGIALVTKSGEFTYEEVNTLANKLAHYLRKECTVKANDIVGILLDRSEWMVISVLAILKSGAAYLPIDPEYPKERRKYLLDDSKTQVLVTESNYMFDLDGYAGQLFVADLQMGLLETDGTNPVVINKNTDLAYVIYTSGSTGLPKGCLLEHHSLFNYISWANTYYFEDDSCGNFDLFSSLSFDFTITSIFCPLTRGKLIHIFDQSIEINKVLTHSFSPASLTDTIKLTPSHISLLQYLDISVTRIRKVITGGEALTMKHVEILKKIDPAIAIFNEYGPTEATVGCIVKKIETHDPKVLIGTPIANTRVYILDVHLDVCPVAMAGEIYLTGEGLARGYLNRNDLNLQKFIPSPFQSGEILYKTGDTGRWLPDGNIEYLGRNDDQVKINGYRVELGEVEQYLLGHYKEFKEIAVVTLKDKENTLYLAAYIITDHKFDAATLRTSLVDSLPGYMIPRHFVKLEKLPLTVNGKVDKSLLPDPAKQEELVYEAPRTSTEQRLQRLWEEVLNIERVGIKDKFLEIGGHSLKAVQLVSRIYKDLQIQVELRDIFELETIESLAGLLDKSIKTKYEKIQPVAEQAYYDLSHGQKRLWIHDQLGEEKSAYHVLGCYQLEGALNPEGVEWAMRTIIDRHEILRTNFTVVEGEPRQKIQAIGNHKFKIAYKDLRGVAQAETLAKELVTKQINSAFDLSNGILLRGLLIQTEEQKHILVMVMHHIISDGWSMGILVKEFLRLYDAYLKGKGNVLTPLKIQYKDYAVWQAQQLNEAHLSASKKYWMDEFSEEIPMLDLPSDRLRPVQRTYNGSRAAINLGAELSSKLRSYSLSKGVSLFMSLLGAVKTLLFKYSHQEDIVIGTPVAGRDHYDLEDQIGLYINTVAIRTKFSAEESLGTLIEKVKEKTIAGFNHQQYPFDYLVDNIVLERDTNRNPIFDVLIALQNISIESEVESMEGISATPYQAEQAISKFDLTFNFIDSEQEITGVIEYNSDLYNKERIERMISHLNQLFRKLVEDDQVLLKDLEYITSQERYQLLKDFNNTTANYPKEKTIQKIFEEQVSETPEAVAVVFGETKLSYRALNEQANQLAHYLRQTYEVKADDLIGIMTDRSEQMIIGILGILKSGAAYLPIDPTYPDERVKYILNDGKIKVLLSEDQHFALKYDFSGLEVVSLKEKNAVFSGCPSTNPTVINQSTDLSYVMYTSGSTGVPKGVAVEHKSVIRLIKNTNYTALNNTHRVLQLSNYVFDGSVFDLYGALLNGAELHLVDKDVLLSNERLVQYITAHKVNITFITTALFNNIVDFNPEIISSFDKIYFGGELASPRHISIALANRKTPESIVHVYGPTEGTTFSTYHVITSLTANATSVSIGKPIANSTVYILDKNLHLVPVGVSGEIYIGGDGLARGYLGKEELTATQFLASPYDAEKRLYKTGDVARWMEDGTIEFLGRVDDQVKIRGYRIELGEIESVMRKCEGVEDVLVIVTESGSEKQLTGYYKAQGEKQPAEVKAYLKNKLPDYMVPSGIIKLTSFPLSANGKIDKGALPDPAGEIIGEEKYHGATNETERRMIKLWEEILGKRKIGIKDKFLEIGGHSLKAMQLVSRIYKDLNIQIELKDLFALETIEALAAHMNKGIQSEYRGIERIEEQEYYELSHGQKRLWILDQLGVEKSAYHVLGSYKLEGEVNIAGFEWSLSAILERHEILRTSFEEIDGLPKQRVHHTTENSGFKIIFKDLREAEGADALAKELINEHVNKGFDLTQVPLLRCLLIQTGNQEYLFILVMHHIISDGWSMEILVKEFLYLYNAYSKDEVNDLPPLKIQYRDYAFWQQQQLNDGKSALDEQYWAEEFKEGIPVLNLPGDRPRPAIKTYNGSREVVKLSKELSDRLKEYCQNRGISLFMSLLGCVKALLYKYSHQEHIIIGTPIAGRGHYDLEDQLGLYINTIPIRTEISSGDSLRVLIEKIKAKTIKCYDHQLYPFDYLVENLAKVRDASRSPIFDVMVVLQNMGLNHDTELMQGLQIRAYDAEQTISKFDLTFNFVDTEEEIEGVIEFNTDLFDRDRIERMVSHYEQMVRRLVDNDEILLRDVEYISGEERYQLLEGFNEVLAEYPRDKNIQSIFEEQVLKTPESTAVVFNESTLSYRQLNEISNQLAHYLKDKYKIKAGDLIGLMVERTEWMIIGILGILKSGAAYLPIEPSYPEERIRFTIADASIKTLITDGSIKNIKKIIGDIAGVFLKQEEKTIKEYPKENPKEINTPTDLAYVIYTSGSTGKPKGVMVEHRNVIQLLLNDKFQFSFGEKDIWPLFHSICFDVSVWEIFGALLYGGKLIVVSKKTTLDPHAYLRLLEKEKVTVLNKIPSTFEGIVQQATDTSFYNLALRYVIFAGEALNPGILKKWHIMYPQVRFVNMYGITEITVHANYKEITQLEMESGINNIGKPMPANNLYIFDQFNKLVPVGIVGEIVIGGEGVTRGYLNRDQLTKERYIKNPYNLTETVYRSGDLGMRMSNGEVIYCGRNDYQVKIRGFRVELGEIENHLSKYLKIENAIVLSRDDAHGDKYLIAYILSKEEYAGKDLRIYLKAALPDYMIPSYFIFLKNFPLTLNGKLDRNALPLPEMFELKSASKFEDAQNEIEDFIRVIWENILNVKPIGTRDNFFEIGGNSLKVIRAFKMLNEEYPDLIKIADLFDHPTIKDQANLILSQSSSKNEEETEFKVFEL